MCESPATCAIRALVGLPGFDGHDPIFGRAMCAPCQDARSRKRNAAPIVREDVRAAVAVLLVHKLTAP
jgi:hypothetical protein